MENRFGIKDLFLFLLIGGLIVAVVVAMWQFDRQYQEILDIKRQNSELTRDVVDIKRQLAEGIVAVGGNGSTPTTQSTGQANLPDGFRQIKEAEKKPGFARGDWLVDNFSTKIGRLTPLVSTDIYQRWVENQVMEGLAMMDPDTMEYAPRLARSWDLSPDGLRFVFYLRRGVSFSDGHPMTADDVVFTFNWMMNPAVNAASARSYFTKLKEVKALDPYTVEVTFTEPYFLNFDQVSSLTIMPKHFYSRFTPEDFNEKTGLLMGTGPYRLENPETWTPGQLVQLVRNDRYWGPSPTFDRLVYHEVQEETASMVLYGNQEHDILRCTPEMYEKMLKDKRVMSFSNAMSYDSMFGGYIYCGWNQVRRENNQDRKTVFADKRVRQAMTMLLDRERMAKEIFLGYVTVASGPFMPQNPQSNPNIKPWAFDPASARALLEHAGIADRNGDGVLEKADGTPFKFVLTYPSGSETWEKVVLFMKDSYARAGVVMEPERVDWPVLQQKINQHTFDAVTLGWSSVPESDPYQIFHSSQIEGEGDNRTSYRSPELDKLIDKARVTMDRAQRMKLWNQVHAVLHEDQPYTFLFYRKALRLFNNRIQNIGTSKMGLNYEQMNPFNPIPWYVPTDRQRYTK